MKPHLIAALLFVSAGCATNRPSPMLPPEPAPAPVVKSDFHPVELQPKWRQFVLDHYQDAVRHALTVPEAARFPGEPDNVIQSVDPAGRVRLLATGGVNTLDRHGSMVRSKYMIYFGETVTAEAGGTPEVQVFPVAAPEGNRNDLSY